MGPNLGQVPKACNLFRHWFRLLENETVEIFKFGGTKVCKAEEVREYFINPKFENEVFD